MLEKKIKERIINLLKFNTSKIQWNITEFSDLGTNQEIEKILLDPFFRNELVKDFGVQVFFVTNEDGKVIPQNIRKIKEVNLDKFSESESTESQITASKGGHEYILPSFTSEIECLLACGRDWNNERSVNLRFVGPHGSGKSELASIVAKRCGFDKVYMILGRPDLSSGDILGEKTIEADPLTKQTYIKLQKGSLEQAMTHGLKKDADGNPILDLYGKVIVESAPALLFYDEYAASPSDVNIIFNQVAQIPRNPGESRELVLNIDGGRIVKSHPGFAMILSGNTIGRGYSSGSESIYTAQGNQQDASFLDRIRPVFEFGYNLLAEKKIMMQKLQDDEIVLKMEEFIEKIRKQFKDNNIETLISTRMLVEVCENISRYKKAGFKEPVGRGIYRTIYSDLTENEKPSWVETINLIFGIYLPNLVKTETTGIWR